VTIVFSILLSTAFCSACPELSLFQAQHDNPLQPQLAGLCVRQKVAFCSLQPCARKGSHPQQRESGAQSSNSRVRKSPEPSISSQEPGTCLRY
jgi:hypothetical protein